MKDCIPFAEEVPPPEPEKKYGEWVDLPKLPPAMPLPEILENTRSFLSRYLIFKKPSYSTVIALWTVHTWVIQCFDYTPYLYISSPVRRCGKSRVFDCLQLLCAKPWAVVSVTEAVLFRKIEKDSPTLLLDETDTIFPSNGADDGKEGVRSVLNAGFERRATVPRCVGPTHTLTEFHVFCPKAFAGIGKLPDTVADRSIEIAMVRRARSESVERLRMRNVAPIAKPIAVSLEAWSAEASTVQSLHAARPSVPHELGDRAADICEPLLAIADMAGGMWPAMARSALVELCSEGASEESTGAQLLGAIREIFTQEGKDKISTRDLLEALIARDNGEPWAIWWERDVKDGKTRGPAGRVARYLKQFDIIPEKIRLNDTATAQGYKLALFEDAFSRYLPGETLF